MTPPNSDPIKPHPYFINWAAEERTRQKQRKYMRVFAWCLAAIFLTFLVYGLLQWNQSFVAAQQSQPCEAYKNIAWNSVPARCIDYFRGQR